MKIDVNFTVPVPPQDAWPLLLDVPHIVPCVPGAVLTQELDDRRYKGQVTLKVGPVQLTFAGEAQITDIDEQARTAKVQAKGADAKGRGSASATAEFSLHPDAAGTRIDVVTDLQLVGAVAQYGRAQGLIKEIATQIVGQFAANLREEIIKKNSFGAHDEATGHETKISSDGIQSMVPDPASQQQSTEPSRELSAFALIWAVLKSSLSRLFGNKS
jgi:uncharacterized protein